MTQGRACPNPAELAALEARQPYYVETRQGAVKRVESEMRGRWAVGPWEGRVRWLFEYKADTVVFVREIGLSKVLVLGYLGPPLEEAVTWKEVLK